MDKEIRIFLTKLRRRLGIQKAMNLFPFVLSIGFFFGFLHLLFAYFYPFYYANIIAVFWIAASILFGSIYFFFHFPKEKEAAHIGDTIIGQERLITSLELRGRNEPISYLQKEDTVKAITVCNIKQSFPYQLHLKTLLFCILIISFFFLFLSLPSKAKQEAKRLYDVKQEVKKEIAQLDDIKKELSQEKVSVKKSPSALEAIGKKLEEHNKLDQVKELLEQTKKEYASSLSKQELQKAKERLRVKLENMTEEETSPEKQMALSDLMKQMGFSAYQNKKKETALSSENPSAASKTKGNSKNNTEETNQQKETSSHKNKNNNSENKNSSNQLSGNQSGSSQKKGTKNGTGKDHGSKKGIERKSEKEETKEKIIVTNDMISKDKNLTGAVSDDGNSHKESSKQQLSFGKKEPLEKVAKEYAEDALTTIDNNDSISYQMKDMVQSYFDDTK